MKIKLLTSAMIIAFGALTVNAAEETPYFKIQAGATYPKKVKGVTGYGTSKIRNTGVVGVEFGSKFNDEVTVGFGIDYRPNIKTKNALINQRANNMSGMINAYYNPNGFGVFKPYVGAGLGISGTQTKKSAVDKKHTKTNFAWQVMAGASMAVNDTTDFSLGYRYVDAGKFNRVYKSRLKSNEILAGLTFRNMM